jgi:glycosyltransferase involved in cell wall biosynthesis
MPRICLVTPGHLSTNPRLVKEAQALTRAGYTVQIVHGQYSPWGVQHDRGVTEPAWTTYPVCFGRQQADLITHIRQRSVQNAAFKAFRFGARSPIVAQAAHAPVTRDLIRTTCAAPRADLYVAHYTAALPAAAEAARKHAARYAFDAEDFHLGEFPERPEYENAKAIIRRIEKTYLPEAAYVTAASPLIARAYADTYGLPEPVTILNVVSRANAPAAPEHAGSATPGPSMYWFSQTIGPGRGLETALSAIARCRSKPHFYIRGIVAVGYRENLERLAASLDITRRVHLLQPVPPAELERAGSAFDFGFCGEESVILNRQFALANKVFSYMCSGLPMALSATAAHRRFSAEKAAYAFVFGDAQDLASKLDEYFSEPVRLSHARAAAFNAAASIYNWEQESRKLLRIVESNVGPGRTVSDSATAVVAEACR